MKSSAEYNTNWVQDPIQFDQPTENLEIWYYYDPKSNKGGVVNFGQVTTKKHLELLIKAYSGEFVYNAESEAPSWVLNRYKIELKTDSKALITLNNQLNYLQRMMYK